MNEFNVREYGSNRVLNKFGGVEFKEKTGTSHTVSIQDHADVLDLNNAGTITVTLPDSVPAGFHCVLRKTGLGNVLLAAETTLEAENSYTTVSTQLHACTIIKKDANTWVALGLES